MKPKINRFWGWITVALVVLTIALCIIGANKGVLLVRSEARPEDTAETFFESVVIGKYEDANVCLENYSSLGLEKSSPNPEWNALLASYDYALLGEAERRGDTAVQKVRLRYLDLNALEKDLSTPLVTPAAEEGEEPQPIYPKLQDLLAHPEDYYATAELPVTLHYAEGQWLLHADDALLSALAGGK